jgi:C4-type Zn-finger protein
MNEVITWTYTENWTRTERIICPNCDHEQDAEVWQANGFPHAVYVHTCENCEYTITESEWNLVPTPQGADI